MMIPERNYEVSQSHDRAGKAKWHDTHAERLSHDGVSLPVRDASRLHQGCIDGDRCLHECNQSYAVELRQKIRTYTYGIGDCDPTHAFSAMRCLRAGRLQKQRLEC